LGKNEFFIAIYLIEIFRDATSHGSPAGDNIAPVNKHLAEELRKFFPKTLIVPVLGKLFSK
jgi:hypothetical protein